MAQARCHVSRAFPAMIAKLLVRKLCADRLRQLRSAPVDGALSERSRVGPLRPAVLRSALTTKIPPALRRRVSLSVSEDRRKDPQNTAQREIRDRCLEVVPPNEWH